MCDTSLSAGILYICNDKDGAPYILLALDKKREEWGPLYGRPDDDDIDLEWTAVRESDEESLGVLVDRHILYKVLKNPQYRLRVQNSGLFVVSFGTISNDERQLFVKQFEKELDFRREQSTLTKSESEVTRIMWVDIHKLITNMRKGKSLKGIKLRSHFERNLTLLM
uniref:Uncharacterized protein n=1 Tax=Lygus hesperus TaxID=30085 RepID=A0A0A9W7E9_LYGHE